MPLKELMIADIDRTVARSFRFRRYDHAIADYAASRRAGDQLPPPVVFFDGERYRLADGEHRVSAWELDKLKSIKCDVREGSYREAVEYASGANARHGLRRTPGDVGLIVTFLLRDAEYKKWTNARLAKMVCCDPKTIANYRDMLGAHIRFRTAENKKGEEYTIDAKAKATNSRNGEMPSALPSVKCPHCGRKFNLVRSTGYAPV